MFLIDWAYQICGRFVKKRNQRMIDAIVKRGISVTALKTILFLSPSARGLLEEVFGSPAECMDRGLG